MDGGGELGGSPPGHQNHSTHFNPSQRQVKVNTTLKDTIILFSGISTSAAQRLVVLLAVSAATALTEFYNMVNMRFGWCCWFEGILAKHDTTIHSLFLLIRK